MLMYLYFITGWEEHLKKDSDCEARWHDYECDSLLRGFKSTYDGVMVLKDQSSDRREIK